MPWGAVPACKCGTAAGGRGGAKAGQTECPFFCSVSFCYCSILVTFRRYRIC